MPGPHNEPAGRQSDQLGDIGEMLDELAEAGLKTKFPFTLDPRAPFDFENLFLNEEQQRAFEEMIPDFHAVSYLD